MDTRFSSAIHALILISQSATPVNSEQIAVSVGTNPSYIRKLTARLNKAGIIEGRRGISGFRLLRQPGDITLLDIYRAVMDTDSVHLFDLHHNPNDTCIVGHNIRPVLGGMFQQMDDDVNRRLQEMTLADCISGMRAYMTRTSQADPGQSAANNPSRTGAADARE
ncbi:Rrf2 family transcriptional regulator [Bifidobacterium boum]|uniref:Transcriptional regulator n=1 Tax=Bifidobacterium boum TaxID=78343 RepID=A0A086ZPE1_9BIFI|nr:Rrf2 family transcriptional regulator [Bifidobacterium boum]KFI48391.1 transcriptional regulator [Bifidobacterium boum]